MRERRQFISPASIGWASEWASPPRLLSRPVSPVVCPTILAVGYQDFPVCDDLASLPPALSSL